ncbi:MAG: YgjV family protein [Clostridia bacterium]|nr:YgjV family protein [Clostridia bacterium]
MNFIIIQIIGAIGYSLLALSYFQKEKIKILLMQIIAYVMFIVHYYLLDGITGSICNLIGLFALVTIYLFEKKNVKNKKILAIGMIPFIVAIALFTYRDIYSIFPIVASIIVILSFLTKHENVIRMIGIISAICWLIYAIVFKSYVAIAFEVIMIISTITALVKNKKSKNEIN